MRRSPAMRPLPFLPPLLPTLPVLALLMGCGGGSAPAPRATATAAADDYGARVAALSPRLRAGVMLRAIRDAGQDCQDVVDQAPLSAGSGPPTWLATCQDHRRWLVAVTPDGTASVTAADRPPPR